MDADPGALDGRAQEVDREWLMREVASLRTYLLVVAGKFAGVDPVPGKGLSDLVHSVLGDVFDEIQHDNGRFKFNYRSDKELRAWLVQRLEWAYRDRERRRRRDEQVRRDLPNRPAPATPSSEYGRNERAWRMAEARQRLDPADRELIEWRVDQDLTLAEIGRRRGYSASYARRACCSALRNLRSNFLGPGGSAPA